MRFDPTQVPTFPVEIDQSHPLAQGLLSLFVPALGLLDLVTGLPWIPSNSPQLGGCSYGQGLYLPANGTGVSQPGYTSQPLQAWQQPVNIGLFAVGYFENIGEGNYPAFIGLNGVNVYAATVGSPVNFIFQTLSGNEIVIPQTAPIATAMVGTTGPNGSGFTVAGVGGGGQYGGSVTYPSNTTLGFGGGTASNGAVLIAGGFFNASSGALSNAASWLQAEPFAMLRPIRRRTYFVPASSGASLSVAGRVAPFVASVGLKFGASASIQAASPPPSADVALVPQVQATIAGAVHPFGGSIAQEASATAAIAGASAKPSAALALAAHVETTIVGIERELFAAIDLNTGNAAFIEIAGALPPFRSSIAGVVSVSASVAGRATPPQGDIAALLSAAMSVAGRVYGPSANVRLSAGVTATMDIAAILAPLSSAIAITPAVPSSRIIRVQPVVRETSPLGAAPIAFWSQRAAGDVDTFSVDFSPLLAAGEALTGTPAITVPTGDLTVADVTVSGSIVSLTISGTGTQGNYSSLLIDVTTTSERTISLTGLVVTGAFLPAMPNPQMGAMLMVSPAFGPRAAGDADIYAADFSPWLDAGETIVGCSVSALTGDLAVSEASYAGSIVTWQASGSGTPGAWTAFLAVVQTSAGRTLGLYCGVRTARG